ncbi:MAG: right-handed parallel beta-helix repeat-containing protein [Archangium sp.]|nr:right-handed parallel beta-helix repeat-containing protein [Archangium sp.]MDP3569067.1 right-handed parallel beta-helix repeat-containing protein [Archangium sp.]
MKLLSLSGVLALALVAAPAQARDWFVREGASGGDGSMGKPFSDPWEALDVCEAKDAIHVTGGKYFGRSNLGMWEIKFDGVQLIGGYDKDFKSRDPWKNSTQLLWDKNSKNWPKEDRLRSIARNLVIDGITIDMRDQIQWAGSGQDGRAEANIRYAAMRFIHPVTVRNSVIVNPDEIGIICVQGSVIENNVIMNVLLAGVVVNFTGAAPQTPAIIRNNTIAFAQDEKKPGFGGYRGAALSVKAPATITNNILVNSDNSAIFSTIESSKISLTKNVFFMNLFANVSSGTSGTEASIDDKNMDELEELGLKAADGNEVKNPELPLDPKWLDRFSKRTAAVRGKVTMDDWNKARQAMGLPLMGSGGASASGLTPAYELDQALKLVQPRAKLSAGARAVPLEVKLQGGGDSGPARDYAKSDVSQWLKNASPVDGKAVEISVAIGNSANISSIPSQYKSAEHAGNFLYDPNGSGERFVGFYKKGSAQQRFVDENDGWYTGRGKPDRLFTARGIAYVLSGVPRVGFFIESIEPAAPATAGDGDRPQGRDWFVRAGASGGDGSKDKPFKDPWQALEKVEAGDSVHVTEGEYLGKLKVGRWKIETTNVALIGGYNKDFTDRNPWKYPTRLYSPADLKANKGGYTIEGVDDHTGAIVDGFIFDKKTNNKYEPDGDLMYSESDKSEHIWFARPGCVIRNNVFLNGAEGALRVAGGQTVENNIFINHVYRTVKAERGFGGTFVFKNNTVLFSWDPIRFGQGKGSNGHLLSLEGQLQAVVDNNIFEFADNDAIRMAAEAKDVELTNNTFSKNLWSNLQRPSDWTAVDDKEWSKLADFKFKKVANNQLAVSAVPLEKGWFDVYVSRVAPVPGKVQMDDWNQLRELIGQPVIATGSEPGKGFAPAYDWAKATQLFPRNAKVTAGARATSFPVKFTGSSPVAGPTYDYEESTWDVAKNRATWDKLEGKRVSLKLVLRSMDTQYQLDDVKVSEYQPFTATGPDGIDSGGLPLRLYVKKGTRVERVVRNARSYTSGSPEEWYIVKGVVRSNRQMIAEVVEKAE